MGEQGFVIKTANTKPITQDLSAHAAPPLAQGGDEAIIDAAGNCSAALALSAPATAAATDAVWHEGVVVWEPGERVVAQTALNYSSTHVIFPGDEGVVLGPHPSKRGKIKVAWDRFEADGGPYSTVFFDEIRPLSNDKLITGAAPAMPHAASLVTQESIDDVALP
eukprot:NODE_2583_length_910_cov_339.756725.p2 GENE.NODE_2583_length_910_cov_339.756725~~NODE_2583_length_910_cov_339.756725.p2  ORF type:complete len:165 (+),score=41.04 NODE_2583_length_910_cov_339.756725:3-497(+)